MSSTKPLYKLPHETLPYELERSLPLAVIDNIYSFLRPAYTTKKGTRVLRLEMELNHKISGYYELLEKRKKAKAEKDAQRKKLVESLDKIISGLEASLR
jgi:hypothetical protein